MTTHTFVLATLTLLATTPLPAQTTPDLAPYLMPDRTAEIALARSAAPKTISDSATVFVLTRTGLVEAAHGTNGWTCAVLRSFSGGLKDPDFWSPTLRAPLCLNPQATSSIFPENRKRIEWIMAGVGVAEIAERTARAYASHELPMPAPGAMSYMLSHEQILGKDNSHWKPHLMFFFDRSLPASNWGAGGFTAPVINASVDDDKNPVMTLFVPVRQWSDGSPALPDAGH